MLRSTLDEGLMKEALIVSGLVGVQVVYAVNMVLLDRVLALGLDPIFIVIFSNFVNSLFLLPFAIAFERKKWPTRLSLGLVVQFLLIALGGVTAFQTLMLLGVEKTSPSIASAMPNLAPGFIFVIAACLRFEKFDLWCNYSRAKILGTFVCLGGAISMSFLQSRPISQDNRQVGVPVDVEWITGCFYLLSAVVVLSCTTVMQAVVMVGFPAPISLCAVVAMIGSILTASMQLIAKGEVDVGSPSISLATIIAVVFEMGATTSICVAFQTWCVKRKGPVLVSIFNPIQTVSSAILSAIILKQLISLGSFAGMLLMFIGLYMVLWAKKKEGQDLVEGSDDAPDTVVIYDVEKPLLS